MSDVTSEYGFILTEPETLTGHVENLCSVASEMIWYLFFPDLWQKYGKHAIIRIFP